jgi:hypothetical protein
MMADEKQGDTFSPEQFISEKASTIPRQAGEIAGEGRGTPAPAPGFVGNPPSAPLQAPESGSSKKQFKTAAELAEMIEMDLSRHPDCPKAGFRVTVYGWPRWRAMLTIEPAAGAVPNPREWRDLTQDFAERLRRRYDLAWE